MTALHPLGTYTKNGKTKVADTPADAVALTFDGFTHVPEEADDAQVDVEVPDEVDKTQPTPSIFANTGTN